MPVLPPAQQGFSQRKNKGMITAGPDTSGCPVTSPLEIRIRLLEGPGLGILAGFAGMTGTRADQRPWHRAQPNEHRYCY